TRRLELPQLDRAREGIARDRQVVVSEHRVAPRQPLHEPSQPALAARPREEAAAQHRQVGLPRLAPARPPRPPPPPAGGGATPRWKSERWATRRPSSSGPRRRNGPSSFSSRTHPA